MKPGITYGQTDDYGYNIVDKDGNTRSNHNPPKTELDTRHHAHSRFECDDPTSARALITGKLTYRYQGRDFRLTDVHGHVIRDLIS